MNRLGHFVLEEMQKKNLKAREFARQAGLNHQTVNELIDFTKEEAQRHYPSIKTLLRLAEFTGADPCALLLMIIPESSQLAHLDAEAMIRSQQIARLPKDLRKTVDALIVGAALNALNEKSEGA